MLRIYNSIPLEDNSRHGKLVVTAGNATFEFVAGDAGEFKLFIEFEKQWQKQCNMGHYISLEHGKGRSSFNVRSISAIDISSP